QESKEVRLRREYEIFTPSLYHSDLSIRAEALKGILHLIEEGESLNWSKDIDIKQDLRMAVSSSLSKYSPLLPIFIKECLSSKSSAVKQIALAVTMLAPPFSNESTECITDYSTLLIESLLSPPGLTRGLAFYSFFSQYQFTKNFEQFDVKRIVEVMLENASRNDEIKE
ncbi:hypothetical protein PMAYCL1PPCAC_19007, partial [Pristionchus mayeri]